MPVTTGFGVLDIFNLHVVLSKKPKPKMMTELEDTMVVMEGQET